MYVVADNTSPTATDGDNGNLSEMVSLNTPGTEKYLLKKIVRFSLCHIRKRKYEPIMG